MAPALLGTTGVIFTFVSLLFILSLIIRRNDVADVAWGIGILLVALTSIFRTETPSPIALFLTLLASLWGVRLALRIYLRNRKKGEDPRYKVWRDTWGKWFYIRSYFQVYLLQGALMILVGYPFIHMEVYGGGEVLSLFTIIGALVWVLGYYFEVVGDYQLDQFLKDPANKGTIMDRGLWKYTRHPNYFGEVTMWWGIWLIVLPLPLAIIALISPLTITYLILKVSGIPMLEKRFENDPTFQAYKKRTSAFFPLPRRTNLP
jgi:steroid 5-alpha reductase family enzyme